jgi:peptidoglycan/LPS O-acetylase OafA/YrhL
MRQGSSWLVFVGFLAALIVLVLALAALTRRRPGRLVFLGIGAGILLQVFLAYDVYASVHRLPLLLGGYFHMLAFLGIVGLMTLAGLMAAGRLRTAAFGFIGLYFAVYTALLFSTNVGPWVWYTGLFILVPFLVVLNLAYVVFLWEPKRTTASRLQTPARR